MLSHAHFTTWIVAQFLALNAHLVFAGMLLPVQKLALSVFPTLPPFPDGELWLALLNTLLRLLKPHQLEQVRNITRLDRV